MLRVIDIVSWKSAVAQGHGINSIPHLVLYENGRKVAEGTGQVLSKLGR